MSIGRIRTKLNPTYGKQNYILAFGINSYKQHFFPNLDSCRIDINNFVDFVTENFECFDKKNTKTVFNEHATLESIKTQIKEKALSLNSEWNLIIYIAGHGDYSFNTKKGYIIPHDADYNNTRSFIAYDTILNWLENSNIFHVVVIADVCHGGTLFDSTNRAIERDVPKAYKIPSRWGFTSGRNEKVKDGTKRKASPFSQALLAALQHCKSELNDITIRELMDKTARIFEASFPDEKQMPEALPLKTKKHNGGQFVFVPRITERKEVYQPIPVTIKPKEWWMDNYSGTSKTPPQSANIRDIDLRKQPTQTRGKSKNHFYLILSLIGTIVFAVMNNKEPIPLSTRPNGRNNTSLPVIITNGSDIGSTAAIPTDSKQSIGDWSIPNSEMNKIPDNLPTSESIENKDNIVFVGSFGNKGNAEAILNRLKEIGYNNAEIIMKENLPYQIVVSGFYLYKSQAKAEMRALRKRGIEVYYAKKDLSTIYRAK